MMNGAGERGMDAGGGGGRDAGFQCPLPEFFFRLLSNLKEFCYILSLI